MSRYHSERDCKVYVGDLPSDVSRADIEEVFDRYSSMRNVWVARNPPGFAFVEFDDARDAKDACYDLDGTRICGRHVKVEISNGRSRRGGRDGGYGGGGRGYGGRGFGGGDRRNESCYACGERGHFARDCKHGRRPGDGENRDRRRYRSRSRSISQSPPRRRYSRSRSRSP